MLVIRLQRTGRKGHAQFRVIVQDSRRTPTSGRIVAAIGNFNPHTKQTAIDKEKAEFYLKNGAQPSERVARLLKSEGVKLPEWVKQPVKKERTIRNADKLRRNRPAEEAAPAPVEEPAAEVADEAPAEPTDAPADAETTAEVAEVEETEEVKEVADSETAKPAEEKKPEETV